MNKLYILTGPPGVGKSTISNLLASSLEKSVLIEGDTIYNFFIGGRIKPWYKDAPLDLFWNNCIYLIKSYLENGYDVVFNYIINPSNFKRLEKEFSNYEIVFKVLLTTEEEIITRDKNRPLDCQMGLRSIELLNSFKNYNYDKKYLLDTTNLTKEETLKQILNS